MAECDVQQMRLETTLLLQHYYIGIHYFQGMFEVSTYIRSFDNTYAGTIVIKSRNCLRISWSPHLKLTYKHVPDNEKRGFKTK